MSYRKTVESALEPCGPPCDKCTNPITGLHIHITFRKYNYSNECVESFVRGYCSEACAMESY